MKAGRHIGAFISILLSFQVSGRSCISTAPNILFLELAKKTNMPRTELDPWKPVLGGCAGHSQNSKAEIVGCSSYF